MHEAGSSILESVLNAADCAQLSTHISLGQTLRSKLLAEAEQSARQNASLAMRWADLFTIDVPQDLRHSVQQQEKMCQDIIDSKDELISEMKDQLIRKDDDYVKVRLTLLRCIPFSCNSACMLVHTSYHANVLLLTLLVGAIKSC